MKIDEGAFEAAAYRNGLPSAAEETRLRGFLGRYLAALPALPSAEPGRDRIAVVVDAHGLAEACVISDRHRSLDDLWRAMEDEMSDGPFARAIIRCSLPRPSEPVEVEGSVEVAG